MCVSVPHQSQVWVSMSLGFTMSDVAAWHVHKPDVSLVCSQAADEFKCICSWSLPMCPTQRPHPCTRSKHNQEASWCELNSAGNTPPPLLCQHPSPPRGLRAPLAGQPDKLASFACMSRNTRRAIACHVHVPATSCLSKRIGHGATICVTSLANLFSHRWQAMQTHISPRQVQHDPAPIIALHSRARGRPQLG